MYLLLFPSAPNPRAPNEKRNAVWREEEESDVLEPKKKRRRRAGYRIFSRDQSGCFCLLGRSFLRYFFGGGSVRLVPSIDPLFPLEVSRGGEKTLLPCPYLP